MSVKKKKGGGAIAVAYMIQQLKPINWGEVEFHKILVPLAIDASDEIS